MRHGPTSDCCCGVTPLSNRSLDAERAVLHAMVLFTNFQLDFTDSFLRLSLSVFTAILGQYR